MTEQIIVAAQSFRGEYPDIVFEMMGLARGLADALKTSLVAAALGRESSGLANRLGLADLVVTIDDASLDAAPPELAAAALKALLDARGGKGLVLIGGTNQSAGIGPHLARLAALPFVNFCTTLAAAEGALKLTCRLFGGKMLAELTLAEGRGVVSLCPGSYPAEAGHAAEPPTKIEPLSFPTPPAKTVFKRYIEPETADVDITKEDVLVSVGRGIQSQDNLALAEELAQALGGAVSSSRPIVDQGWLSMARQVGKSGMIVKPRLYLALGISGAPEHWEGMKDSGLIVAINTDKQAPIFSFAHYGACADLLEVVPALTEEVRARKQKVKA